MREFNLLDTDLIESIALELADEVLLPGNRHSTNWVKEIGGSLDELTGEFIGESIGEILISIENERLGGDQASTAIDLMIYDHCFALARKYVLNGCKKGISL